TAVQEIKQKQPKSQRTEHPHIDRVPGVCGGRPKIKGHRIPVWTIAGWNHMEMTVDQILDMYPQLTPGQIHDALSYYFDHREEIDRERAENSETAIQGGFSSE